VKLCILTQVKYFQVSLDIFVMPVKITEFGSFLALK
jgi:hypothetical protein